MPAIPIVTQEGGVGKTCLATSLASQLSGHIFWNMMSATVSSPFGWWPFLRPVINRPKLRSPTVEISVTCCYGAPVY